MIISIKLSVKPRSDENVSPPVRTRKRSEDRYESESENDFIVEDDEVAFSERSGSNSSEDEGFGFYNMVNMKIEKQGHHARASLGGVGYFRFDFFRNN